MRQAREPRIERSPAPGDAVATTTCYMCACRCGIRVHLQNGKVRYIEGNRDHPVNHGVLCGKGSAGLMQHYSPARLTRPLKRLGPRGSGEFAAISWDEALSLATEWLGDVRRRDPRKLALFTGRDQSQALTGWWATQYGTPNYAAHGGFCSVNMAAAGLYTFGGSFWEFGDTDWDLTRYFMLFGVAEDHASNPIKIGLGKLKQRGAKIVAVNPVRTGYNAIADEWVAIKPGTDGLFAAALIHVLLAAQKIDLEYLVSYTNAAWLVVRAPRERDDGLFARDAAGHALVFDKDRARAAPALGVRRPALSGSYTLPDGRRATPVFELLAQRFLAEEYAPERTAASTGIPAATTRRIAAELAAAAFDHPVVLDTPWTDVTGRRHPTTMGRPVSMHAMRGISAHANGFHTCRILHFLQILLGAIDCPGGFRYRPPYPKQAPPALTPAGKPGEVRPMHPLPGPPLGFPTGPEDLLVDAEGRAQRIDKAFSWEAPFAAHGLMHTVLANAARGDPYAIDVLFLYMANMSWNSALNPAAAIEHLTARDASGAYRIPKVIYADSYYSEMVPYADLILADTTYLERWDCISLLDRPISLPDAPADAIRQPVVKPDRDVRPFQDVLIELGARLELPGMANADGSAKFPGGYADYMVNHERKPGIGPLAGFRGQGGQAFGRGAPNPHQLDAYIANGCFCAHELPEPMRYFKHANRDYIDWAQSVGFRLTATPVIFQLYSEPMQKLRLAAQGHGSIKPPPQHRERIQRFFDPLPFWYPPFEDAGSEGDFPLCAITQRPMAMYHSWGSQNAWLRQIHPYNRLYINAARAAALGIADDDWVWITSRTGRVKAQVKLMDGVNADTVWTWNAIGKRPGTWGLDGNVPEVRRGFLVNHLIAELLPEQPGGYRYSNSDPVTGQAAWYDLKVRIAKADAAEERSTAPQFASLSPRGAALRGRERAGSGQGGVMATRKERGDDRA
jgi:anaerobic selenocysteine-containing dehydrogenase